MNREQKNNRTIQNKIQMNREMNREANRDMNIKRSNRIIENLTKMQIDK